MMKKVLLFLSVLLCSNILIASEKSVYEFSWLDKDKEIYVLQNRKFRKAGHFYVGAEGVKTLSGAFIDSYGGNARAGFFFSEEWGIEGVYGSFSGKKNDNFKGVDDQQAKAFYRKVDSYVGGMLTWAPFYSKINTFNKVFYYDWMFGVGVASIQTSDNRNELTSGAGTTLVKETTMGALWNTGLRFYINEHWSVRLDFTGLHAKPKKAQRAGSDLKTNSLFSNYDMGLGLNFAF